jgi:hypothetical protein
MGEKEAKLVTDSVTLGASGQRPHMLSSETIIFWGYDM